MPRWNDKQILSFSLLSKNFKILADLSKTANSLKQNI